MPLSVIFPNFCIGCSILTKKKLPLCQQCSKTLPWIPHSLNYNKAKLATPFYYQEPIDKFIIQLKFNAKLSYARLLGTILGDFIAKLQPQFASEIQAIIPMPLHHKRLKQRGFNQALEIARPIAKRLAIPIDYKSVVRIKNTRAQSQLSAKQRATNVKDAFAINKSFKYQHIAIVEDVITTGHTLNELIACLQQNSNIQTISVWCCAISRINHNTTANYPG